MSLLRLVIEQILGDLHPQLLFNLFISRFVGVILGHLDVATCETHLYGLIEETQNRIQDYLRLFHLGEHRLQVLHLQL